MRQRQCGKKSQKTKKLKKCSCQQVKIQTKKMENSSGSESDGYNNESNVNYVIINTIKKFPVLYAKGSKLYRNVQEKQRAWSSVAKKLEMPEKNVKTKWRNLRDRYVKELRKVKQTGTSGAGTEDVYKSKWFLFEELEFLAAHSENRPTTGNYEPTSLPADELSQASQVYTVEEYTQEASQDENVLDDLDMNDSGRTEGRTPIVHRSGEKSSKKRKTADLIDDKIDQILTKAEAALSGNTSRYATFCSYLTERMEMLPISVARDLEIEFTCRVNSLLSLYEE
ncbi:uncharacterized protein LOC134219882 [Armigeres subalbatus]|uniref:uncharacterized protein LOC134219882 n=1 Tax=Armigeres subalbatus TaxID=124917 RepID=UPI002ED3B86E